MKHYILLATIFTFLILAPKIYAATLRTDSNPPATTKVGTGGSGGVASCPIPNGIVTCGSKNHPVASCGHCGLNYDDIDNACRFPGTQYAMDVAGPAGQPLTLPSINGDVIDWTSAGQTGITSVQAIELFSGTDAKTGDKYWLQFHHSEPGSGVSGASGSIGAKICFNCNQGRTHSHMEIAKSTPSDPRAWVDAPDYLCK